MRLSLWIGCGMFGIKSYAYLTTGSAAILSDAAESVVHVLAVAFATYSLWLVNKPADQEHHYGHTKISFISAGFEGAMITIAAIFILFESIHKWINGIEIQNLDTGLYLTISALFINAALGSYLIVVGKRRDSLILRANGIHVLTDAWTSLGVAVGVALTWMTGWKPLDPICAIVVALNILYSGYKLSRESIEGLMDKADPKVDSTLIEILDQAKAEFEIEYHGLKHLNTGEGHRIDFHLLFEDELSIQEAHQIATEIENRIKKTLGKKVQISSHLEPKKDHERIHDHSIT